MCDCCSQGRNIRIITPAVNQGKGEIKEGSTEDAPEAK